MQREMKAVRVGVVLVVFWGLALFRPGVRAGGGESSEWWPLDPGNVWVYGIKGWPAEFAQIRLWEIEVLERVEGVALVRYRLWRPLDNGVSEAIEIHLRSRMDRVEVRSDDVGRGGFQAWPRDYRCGLGAPEEAFAVFVRFDAGEYRRRGFLIHTCWDGATFEVSARNAAVETDAGTFNDCVRFDTVVRCCADAGPVSEWWCRGLGLAEFTLLNFAGHQPWTLIEFRRPLFERGDANADGTVDIADAVAILNFLFRGSGEPTCLDALDTNDSGDLEITDAILLLQDLFVGGPAAVSEPRGHCGPDGASDDFPKCVDPPCESTE